MDVEKIVKKAKNKDQESIKLLYEMHYNQVYYFAFKILRNEENAKDVLQDTFINAFKYLHTLKDESKFKSWLSKIVINCCNKKYSKTKNEILIDEYTDYGMSYIIETKDKVIEDQIELKEDQKLVLNLIDNLTEKKKEVILLFYYNEFKIKEIAEIIECSEGTVKSRLNSAKKDLKEMLKAKNHNYKAYSISLPVLLLCLKNESINMNIDTGKSIEVLNNILGEFNYENIGYKHYINGVKNGVNNFISCAPMNELCQVGLLALMIITGVVFNNDIEINNKNTLLEVEHNNKLNFDKYNLIESEKKNVIVLYNSNISTEETPFIKIKIPSGIDFNSNDKIKDISIELISDELFNGRVEVSISSNNEYKLIKNGENYLKYSLYYDNVLMNSKYENKVILDKNSKEKNGIAVLEEKIIEPGVYRDILNYNIELIN